MALLHYFNEEAPGRKPANISTTKIEVFSRLEPGATLDTSKRGF